MRAWQQGWGRGPLGTQVLSPGPQAPAATKTAPPLWAPLEAPIVGIGEADLP